MGLIEKNKLVSELSPPLDGFLCVQFVDEFISCERRYIQRDWEPAQLDGGQFAEIAARILYHQDSGNLNRSKDLSDCLKYIDNEGVQHLMVPRSDAIHIARVLRTIYKFRSQRGAVHLSTNYSPNHMDSRFLVESVRWVMNEFLRLYWNGDREEVARTIRELLQFDVPVIGVFGGVLLVQRTDLAPEEEILLLLHYAGEEGLSRREIGKAAKFVPSTVTRSLQRLVARDCRELIELPNGNYRLTDLGSRRVREDLGGKLTF
jgi:hypothetical protein